jgi:hypothetical protein
MICYVLLINYPNRLNGFDKKSTRIEELISSIKKKIKYAAMTIESKTVQIELMNFIIGYLSYKYKHKKLNKQLRGVHESNNLKKDEKD